jgi:hypothetical protein
MNSYPSDKERAIIADAEKLMEETMARYDPSHDAYHGELQLPHYSLGRISDSLPAKHSPTRSKDCIVHR